MTQRATGILETSVKTCRWICALAAGLTWLVPALAQDRQNYFDDPFVQVSSALPGCPAPEPPGMTQEEFRAVAHWRAQRGTSCHLSGQCRLANSYLYDKEIIPRVKIYLQQDSRFDGSSVWVLGEMRIVTLMGCVQTLEQSQAMERAVLLVDDVSGVVNQLMVGATGRPPYKIQNTKAP